MEINITLGVLCLDGWWWGYSGPWSRKVSRIFLRARLSKDFLRGTDKKRKENFSSGPCLGEDLARPVCGLSQWLIGVKVRLCL